MLLSLLHRPCIIDHETHSQHHHRSCLQHQQRLHAFGRKIQHHWCVSFVLMLVFLLFVCVRAHVLATASECTERNFDRQTYRLLVSFKTSRLRDSECISALFGCTVVNFRRVNQQTAQTSKYEEFKTELYLFIPLFCSLSPSWTMSIVIVFSSFFCTHSHGFHSKSKVQLKWKHKTNSINVAHVLSFAVAIVGVFICELI